MKIVVVVALFEALPVGVLISVVWGCPLRRRSRFWLRIVGVVAAMLLPDLAGLLARASEQTAGILLWSGLAWGMLAATAARFVLFTGDDLDPGTNDDGGEGPNPGDDRPTPPGPIGGIPLFDAEQSSTRLRNHRSARRAPLPDRRSRRRERVRSRLWHLRLRPS